MMDIQNNKKLKFSYKFTIRCIDCLYRPLISHDQVFFFVSVLVKTQITLIILWIQKLAASDQQTLVMLSHGYLSLIKTKVGKAVFPNLINGSWLDIVSKNVSHH